MCQRPRQPDAGGESRADAGRSALHGLGTPAADRSRALVGSLQALIAVLVWGASFAATKRALAETSPSTVLFTRSLLATLVIGGWVGMRGGLRALPARDWPRMVALAVLGLVMTQILQAYALQRSTSANTAWLVALNPAITVLLAAWLLSEHMWRKLPGLTLALGGALLVVSGGSSLSTTMALPSTRGDALTVVSTFSWAFFTIWGRGFVNRHPAALTTAHLLLVAAVVFFPGFVLAEGCRELVGLSTTGWLCLAYLGIGCSALGFLLYSAALEHLEASQVAAFIYIEPLIAQALSVALLGEPVTGMLLGGGAAILAGVYLVSRPAAA
jgi:drug/metabolite transporter (DMT)-like permease